MATEQYALTEDGLKLLGEAERQQLENHRLKCLLEDALAYINSGGHMSRQATNLRAEIKRALKRTN